MVFTVNIYVLSITWNAGAWIYQVGNGEYACDLLGKLWENFHGHQSKKESSFVRTNWYTHNNSAAVIKQTNCCLYDYWSYQGIYYTSHRIGDNSPNYKFNTVFSTSMCEKIKFLSYKKKLIWQSDVEGWRTWLPLGKKLINI